MVIKVKKAGSFVERFVGLIGSKKPYPFLIHTRWGIHTFGMKYPIDVLILNNKGIIVKMRLSLAPNNTFFWNPRYNIVVELPSNSIKKMNIKLRDHVDISVILF